jgi:hypothetical protein
VGEFAAVAGELVHTSVELAARELEVAQLQRALTSRVWIEQAKGALAATQGTDPGVAFQQLRARARASSRKLRRGGTGGRPGRPAGAAGRHGPGRCPVREAEARAQAAEQALEAAQAELVQHRAADNLD